jgi:hypothetical protein
MKFLSQMMAISRFSPTKKAKVVPLAKKQPFGLALSQSRECRGYGCIDRIIIAGAFMMRKE